MGRPVRRPGPGECPFCKRKARILWGVLVKHERSDGRLCPGAGITREHASELFEARRRSVQANRLRKKIVNSLSNGSGHLELGAVLITASGTTGIPMGIVDALVEDGTLRRVDDEWVLTGVVPTKQLSGD